MTRAIREPVELAREIARSVIAPNAVRWDAEAEWPRQAVDALKGSGLAGLVVPTAYGGLGHGMKSVLEVCEVLGREDASTGLCFGMHCVATACIAAKASKKEIDALLVPIARGQHWTTLALSEAGTGSHFYLPQTTMVRDGGHYILNGEKSFITNGGHADSYVVSAVDDEEAQVGQFSLFMVPSAELSGGWGPAWDGWGMRGNSSRTVKLDQIRLPLQSRLGEEGDQIWYVFNVVAPFFLVAMAGTYLGVAARAVEEVKSHLSARTFSHTETKLSEVSIVQHKVGRLWAQWQRTRQLCCWAAQQADAGGADALPALCAAKAEAGHAAVDIVNEALTLVGGRGYGKGSVLQRLLRDARAAHVMSPTTDMLYTWTGKSLLGLPLLGE